MTSNPHRRWSGRASEGVEYSVEHAIIAGEDRFLITHNQEREDFDIVDVPVSDPAGTARETARCRR